jgi:WD40 repeat protein
MVQAMALSPDGKQIAMCERESQKVSIADTLTGREIASIPAHLGWPPRNALAYSPDGRRLAGTGDDLKVIDLWDAQTYQQIARLEGHTAPVYVVAISPDGRNWRPAETARSASGTSRPANVGPC